MSHVPFLISSEPESSLASSSLPNNMIVSGNLSPHLEGKIFLDNVNFTSV